MPQRPTGFSFIVTLRSKHSNHLVGGVSQWLGCRSLAGGLCLIYAWSTVTCDHLVGKVSAMGQPTRPTQPSIPSWLVNECNPCRPLNGRPGPRMAVWS